MSAEPALLTLTEIAHAIAQKRFSSREVTQSCLDRIAQWQPRLNAFMAIEADEALAAADAADAAPAKGNVRGALHGTRICSTTKAGWSPAVRRSAAISSRPRPPPRCSG
jgi:Asp-tRNA(Asn)/Glu-tRNA(Gln) amidotransferase A subunit family amidase